MVSVNPKSILFAVIIAVSFIGLSMSLLLIFFYQKLLTFSTNQTNSEQNVTNNPAPTWFNIHIVSLVAVLSGIFTVILGVAGMIFYQRNFTLVNYYPGAVVSDK